jgi:hypothetical protein
MVGRMSQIKIIGIIILTFAVIAPETAIAECNVYYTGEAVQMFGSAGRGNFATCSQCQAYINSSPGFERTHSYCSGTDTPSSTSSSPGLSPGQSATVQVFGSLLDSLVNSILSTKKHDTAQPDTNQIEQQIVDEQAKQKQAEAMALAEWRAQQNKAAKNHQLEQEQRLQQGDALLKEMHVGESSTSAESPGRKLVGFRWDTPAPTAAGATSLSAGRYDTSGLRSVQRLACAADFSKKAQAVQDSNPEQARFFNEQADRVTVGEAVDVACSFPPMPAVPEPVISAQMQQMEKNIQTVQLDIKELQGIETKVQKVKTDKSAAQEKVQQAEAARQQTETDKANAKPEDEALMAEIMRRQAEAQAQLDDANQKLKTLSDQEQELTQRKDSIRQELQQIQQQNKSGEAGVAH